MCFIYLYMWVCGRKKKFSSVTSSLAIDPFIMTRLDVQLLRKTFGNKLKKTWGIKKKRKNLEKRSKYIYGWRGFVCASGKFDIFLSSCNNKLVFFKGIFNATSLFSATFFLEHHWIGIHKIFYAFAYAEVVYLYSHNKGVKLDRLAK